MKRLVFGGMLAVAAIAFYALPARAAFHLWSISEVYSNSDGSVQFIELFTSQPFQTATQNTQITSGANTFTFPSSLSVDTTNKHMLLATAGFSALAGGVTPDFPLPAHFFNPAGDTITYKFTLGSPASFGPSPKTPLSTDGVHSLAFPGPSAQVNSPTNLAGNVGSVNVPPPPTPTGDYNGNGAVDSADYVLWRKTDGQTVANGTAADGNSNGTIDAADYTFWASNFGHLIAGSGASASQAGTVPEPASLALIAAGILASAIADIRKPPKRPLVC